MPVPTFRAVQPQVDIVGRPDKLVGKPRPAAGAEDYASLPKRRVYGLVPPAGVTELDYVAPCWIELADNGPQPGLRIAMAWWKLKKKAPHPVAEDIGDHAKILYKRFCAPEPLDVSDELADLDGINEASRARLANPRFNVCHSRPRIKGRVDLNRVEALSVMTKPFAGRQVIGIK